jgi:hypothetical protein
MGESRIENILEATIAGEPYTDDAQSRIEALLIELKAAIEGGGGGTNYIERNGQRLYLSPEVPAGDIPVGSKGMGFCDATSTFKSSEKSDTLPLTVTADSDIDYKIYGASGGVGESTEDGYKLPIVSQPNVQGDEPVTETVDIYIGDTPLLKGEYADSIEQKIYRKRDVRTEIGLSVTQPYPTVNSQGVGRVSMEKTMSWETELTIKEAGFIYVKDITNTDELILENVGKNGITKRETPAGDNPHTLNLTDPDGNGARLVGYAVVTDGIYETVLYTEEGKATYQQLVDEPGISHLYPGPDDVGEILRPVDPPVLLPKIPSFRGETVVSYDSETTPPENVSLIYGAWHSDLDDINSRLKAIEQAIANGGA